MMGMLKAAIPAAHDRRAGTGSETLAPCELDLPVRAPVAPRRVVHLRLLRDLVAEGAAAFEVHAHARARAREDRLPARAQRGRAREDG